MIYNYIKLAWRVLNRKKFFTAISLFGISFTLGILMVILAFLQSELGTNKPLTHKDDFVLLESLMLQRVYQDTTITIDTVVADGVTVYDTIMKFNDGSTMMNSSEMNNGIAEEYLSDLPSTQNMTIMSDAGQNNVYVNGVKVSLSTVYTDPHYFEVLDHEIVAGRPIDQNDMDQASQVAVMSTKAAKEYFGTTKDVVGKEIKMEGKTYSVIGLFPHNGKIMPYVSPDLLIPYSTVNADDQTSFYHGFYIVLFQKKSNRTSKQLKDEIKNAATLIPLDHPSKPHEDYNEVVFKPKTYNELYAQGIYYDEDETKSYAIMKWILGLLLLFFILLPTLNLINLNVSRIMERSAEIGVRKAFGAHQGNILSQFIVENVVQTLLGGLIGLGLALVLIRIINKGGALGDATLTLSPKFFLYSLLATLVFGILSGLLPAYRMSKLHIVNALKQSRI